MLNGKRILLGVTGGIAAYKAVYLLRDFQKAGADVRVTMTPSATRFVGSETFSSLSRSPAAVDIFEETDEDSWTKHIHWGEWADIFVIAPCTANTLSKIVHGASDNMLTATVMAARCPVLICPTMDGEMYESPAVSQNLKTAESMGFHILEPDTGYLASGLEDKGRLPEPGKILERANAIIYEARAKGPLSGKKVVVSAGPTREFIDPVRFISNPSSGKMGIAMADAAARLGADVVLLKGPVNEKESERMVTESFESADDLFDIAKKYSDADVIIMAAAVADLKPAETHSKKVKKENASEELKLTPTPDILQWFGDHKKDNQTLIGFAMETDNMEKNALGKLTKKNLDWICANSVSGPDTGFAADTNNITLIGKETRKEFKGPKQEIAFRILRDIFDSRE